LSRRILIKTGRRGDPENIDLGRVCTVFRGFNVCKNVLTRFLAWGRGTLRFGRGRIWAYHRKHDLQGLQDSLEEKGGIK
jgi:hypothetical protein